MDQLGNYPIGFDSPPPECGDNKTPVDMNAIGPKQNYPAQGHDSYVGIPGDGIIGGAEEGESATDRG